MTRPVIVIGAGGHAAVVTDALLASGATVLGLVDADPALTGTNVCGLGVLGDDTVLQRYEPSEVLLANGIGSIRNEATRRIVQERLSAHGWRFAGVRHPRAVISPFAMLVDDAQVLAGAVVQVGAEIGQGAVVNTAAVVEHHARIGQFVHVAPRALVCGGVDIGADCQIGAGAVVRQRIRIGSGTLVAAGAVVVSDHPGGGTLRGVPARRAESCS
jgi:sugar O-acyltransferase (sialic acid O-acetyltransferase NeuD family)